MDAERYEQARAVFLTLCELSPEAQLRSLDERCAHDTDLRDAVRKLLEKDAQVGENLRLCDAPGELREEVVKRVADVIAGKPPNAIGRYKIVRTIAEGGMGTVYEAVQDSPRRTVALKVIRPGFASEKLIRRFEYEAQILGLLRHPGIAQIHEASTAETPLGVQPFFAMEFVDGPSVLDYAVAEKLGVRDRLALLIRICDAVHYAHQKGVVHRDLKPANILVDEGGTPKILDFGVARATDIDLKTTTIKTAVGQLIGTIPYMSPEQAGGESTQIDIRSDVYALGVIAFELLAGRLPFEVGDRQLVDILEQIRDEDPPRLGTISRTLRGDLETIVAKSLQKAKESRYASADALGTDIQRYLNDQPIEARPMGRIYQLRKFARRNRGLAAMFVACIALLAAGAAGTSIGYVRATVRESDAVRARAEAEAVTQFLVLMLESANPEELGRDVMVRDILAEAATALADGEYHADQLASARLHYTIGRAFLQLGDLQPACEQFALALEIREAELGGEHVDSISARNALGMSLTALGKCKRSIRLHERNLDLARRLFGEEHEQSLTSLHNLGVARASCGEYSEASEHLNRALALRRRLLGEKHVDTLSTMGNLAELLWRQGQLDAFESMQKRVVAVSEQLYGLRHPKTLDEHTSLAKVWFERGQYHEAEAAFETALDLSRALRGDEHRMTISLILNLAGVRREQGRNDDAVALLSEARSTCEAAFGDGHPQTLTAWFGLCDVLIEMGQYQRAANELIELLEVRREAQGPEHPQTLQTMESLAKAQLNLGEVSEANELFSFVLETRKRVLGPEHTETLVCINNLATLYMMEGDYERAEDLFVEALETRTRTIGDRHVEALKLMSNLGRIYVETSRYDDASKILERAITIGTESLGADHPVVLTSLNNLAVVSVRQREFDRAIRSFGELLEAQRNTLGPQHPHTVITMVNLGNAYRGQEDYESAEPFLTDAVSIYTADFGEHHQYTLRAMEALGCLYVEQGRPAEGERLLARASSGLCEALPDHSVGYRALSWYGRALAEQQEYERAEAILLEALEFLIEKQGDDHPDVTAAAGWLVSLYENWNKPDRAADIRAHFKNETER